MADAAGQPRPDLNLSQTPPETMGFFELLRRLETPRLRFGRAGGPGDEPARLGQRARLSVATRDIAGFAPGDEGSPARVEVEVLGLLGPEGAMPLHLTRWIMARLSERWFANTDDRETSDTSFLDFCNLLQHRLLALYWRAWGDARGEVQIEHGSKGRAQALQSMLAGLGLPGLSRPGSDAELKLRHATTLGAQVHGPERLTSLLSDLIGAPVSLVEFVGHWIAIPEPLQTRLGRDHTGLGTSAVVGARSFQRQTRAELRVGPLSLRQYRGLLDDKSLYARIVQATRFAVGREIEYDLRPVLAKEEVPDPRIGQCQLGRTLWVSPPRRAEAADLRLCSITSERAEEAA